MTGLGILQQVHVCLFIHDMCAGAAVHVILLLKQFQHDCDLFMQKQDSGMHNEHAGLLFGNARMQT